VPPAGAGAVNVTQQLLAPGVAIEAGLHASALNTGGGSMERSALVPDTAMLAPSVLAPIGAVVWMRDEVLEVVGETLSTTVATTPPAMV